jgi:hypothetical protein
LASYAQAFPPDQEAASELFTQSNGEGAAAIFDDSFFRLEHIEGKMPTAIFVPSRLCVIRTWRTPRTSSGANGSVAVTLKMPAIVTLDPRAAVL